MRSLPASEDSAEPSLRPVRRQRIGWLALVGAILLVGGAAVWVLITRSAPQSSDSRSTQVSVAGVAGIGEQAPAFVMPNLNGGTDVRFDAGQPTILTFWAAWCAPCRKEFPLLADASAADPNLRVVGVLYKDIPADARAFVGETGATWENGTDQGGDIARAYGVRAIPQTLFIDRSGTIVGRRYGVTTRSDLEEELRKLR